MHPEIRPDNAKTIEQFLVQGALATRGKTHVNRSDDPHNVDFTLARGCTPDNEPVATLVVPGNRQPYVRHDLTLRRGQSGRLHCTIESYANYDHIPARIEMGPLVKIARAVNKVADSSDLIKYGLPIALYAEVVNDLCAGLLAAKAEDARDSLPIDLGVVGE